MPPFAQAIDNLLNGVSQQPTYLRLPSQAEAQVNAISLPSRGTGKRPGTFYKKNLNATPGNFGNAFIHTVNRDTDNRFRVILFNGDLKVFDEDGVEETVQFPSGKTYLASSTPNQDFRAATNGDVTVITNRTFSVLKTTTVSATQAKEALVTILQGDFDTVYKLTLASISPSIIHTTPEETTAARDEINTQTIALELVNAINASSGHSAFTATRYGSTVHIVRTDGADFTITGDDGLGGRGMQIIKGSTQRFSEVPANAPDGTLLEITGDETVGFDNFWVVHDAANGTWSETVGSAELTSLDNATMPHILERNGTVIDSVIAVAGPAPTIDSSFSGTDFEDGFSAAQNTAGPENTDVSDYLNNAEFFSNLEDANAQETEYTVWYDIEQSLDPAVTTTVSVYYNDGAASTSWTLGNSKTYEFGDPDATDESISFTATLGADYDIRVVLTHDGPSGGSRSEQDPFLTMHGEDHSQPGVTYTRIEDPKAIQFGASQIYPEGTTVTVVINGGSDLDHVVTGGDETGTQVAVAMQILADAETNITATVLEAGVLEIDDSTGSPTVTVDTDYDDSKVLVTDNLGVDADDLITLTINNLTDGSTMTITDNTDKTATATTGLTGGTDNTFEAGDVISVTSPAGQWVFKPATYDARAVGDLVTNPFPSFVDGQINEVFFWKNRLGLCSDEHVVLTQAGDLFNFFRETATDLLDSDPIDLTANDTQVSVLHGAVQWNEALILYSDQSQFVLKGEPLLTPKTARLPKTTEFESSLRIRPHVAGRSIYFAKEESGSTKVFEYFPDPSGRADVNDAENVTSHLPTYISGAPIAMVGSTSNNMLALLTDGDKSKVYVYKYLWADGGREKIQSSWSIWDFGDDAEILGIDFIADVMGLVVKRTDQVSLETMNVDVGYLPPDQSGTVLTYSVLADRIVYANSAGVTVAAYDSGSDSTTITLPYNIRTNTYTVVGQDTFTAGSDEEIQDHTADTGLGGAEVPSDQDAIANVMNVTLGELVNGVQTADGNTAFAMYLTALSSLGSQYEAYIDMEGGAANSLGHNGMFLNGQNDGDIDLVVAGSASPEHKTFGGLHVSYNGNGSGTPYFTVTEVIDDDGGSSSTQYNDDDHEEADFINQGFRIGCTVDLDAATVVLWYEPTGGGTRTTVDTHTLVQSFYDDGNHQRFGITQAGVINFSRFRKMDNFTIRTQDTPALNACVVRTDTHAQVTEVVATGLAENQIKLSGDMTGVPLMIGVCFNMQYEFSKFHRRAFSQTGQPVAETVGRTQVKYINIDYTEARDFSVDVDLTRPKDATTTVRTYSFSDSTVGGVNGVFRVPVMANNAAGFVTIENDSPFQAFFPRASWEGVHKRLIRRQ